MVNYPIEFSSKSKAEKGEQSWKLDTSEGLQTRMTVPEEFGGDEEHPSPEDLFTASIQTCVVATFKSIAERKGLNYKEIDAEIEATLERGEDSRPLIKEAKITLEVHGIEDRDKASKVASATEKNCFIHKSVKTEIETKYNFT